MALSSVKTFVAGEILFASDLNAEFANIYSNGEDLQTPASKAHDMNGFEVVLDADGDSGIIADTDDRIDFRLQNVDLFRMDGTTSASVNGLDLIASATGSDVVIAAQGSDENIDIDIQSKGTGAVLVDGVHAGPLGAQVFSF